MARSSLRLLPIALASALSSTFADEPRDSQRSTTLAGTTSEPPYRALKAYDTQVASLMFTPDGRTLISAASYGPILLWDTGPKQRRAELPAGSRVLALSSDGRQLAVSAVGSSSVRVWELSLSKETRVLEVPDAKEVPLAWFSPDGRKLVTLDWNQGRQDQFAVRRWDLATGAQERRGTIPRQAYPLTMMEDGA